jgi:hypothetical protein
VNPPAPRARRRALAAVATAVALALLASPVPVAANEEDDARAIRRLLDAGNLTAAAAAIETFLERRPRSERAPDLLFELAARESRLFARLSLLARIADGYPGSPRAADALFERIELAHLTGDLRETVRAAARFRVARPADARLPAALAMEVAALLARRQFSVAQQRLATLDALRLAPADRAAADLAFAESFLGQDKSDRARTYLERVVVSGEGDLARAYLLLARIAEGRGDVEEARRLDVLRLRKVPRGLE